MSLPRYLKYKDSCVEWLGPVPAEWNVRPLFSVAEECSEPNVGMRENNLLSLSYGRIVPKDIDSNDGLLPESFETYQIVHTGDIILRLTDLQNDKRSLRTAIVEQSGIITSAYIAARPFGVRPQFLNYLLRAYDASKVFYAMGGGLRQSMKFSDLKRMPILLPSDEEQCRIIEFVERETARTDALVSEQQRLIELLKEKRQAVISHAVTKGLNANVPMRDAGVKSAGMVPAHWGIVPLKRDLAFLTSGSRGWAEHYSEEGKLFIRIGNLTRDSIGLDLTDIQRVTVPFGVEGERTCVKAGDVLFSITAYLGSVAVVPERVETAYVSQHVALARLKQRRFCPRWVAYVALSSFGKAYLEAQSYGGTKVQLSLSDVAQMLIPAPPIPEQQEISDYLDAECKRIERLLDEAERSIALLQERRTALISAAVTGKIDVRQLAEVQTV